MAQNMLTSQNTGWIVFGFGVALSILGPILSFFIKRFAGTKDEQVTDLYNKFNNHEGRVSAIEGKLKMR